MQSQTVAFYLRELANIQLELAIRLENCGTSVHTLSRVRNSLKICEQIRTAHLAIAEERYREAQQVIQRIRREVDSITVYKLK